MDTGCGITENGTLYEELQAIGIEPESITKILITHGRRHVDHIGGLHTHAAATLPAIPNARVYIRKIEWEFWRAPDVDISSIPFPPDSHAQLVKTAKTIFNKLEARSIFSVPTQANATPSNVH